MRQRLPTGWRFYLALGGVAVVVVGMFATSYYGRRSRGVTGLQIPPETKEYLERLAKQIGDLQFLRRSGSGRERDNRDDDEEADAAGFLKRESDNFIVYFRRGDSGRADQILNDAEGSQGRMRRVFNHFPLASAKGGRKLPVYLGNSEADYRETSRCPQWSAGCVRYLVYDDAIQATMYLSPQPFLMGQAQARTVVVHEVAHYTHFDLVTISNLRHQLVWFTEGIASYTAEESRRIEYLKRVYASGRIIPLTEISRYGYNVPDVNILYAEGHSVFQMIEERRGGDRVTALVDQVSRQTDLVTALDRVLGLTLAGLNEMWMEYLPTLRASLSGLEGLPMSAGPVSSEQIDIRKLLSRGSPALTVPVRFEAKRDDSRKSDGMLKQAREPRGSAVR